MTKISFRKDLLNYIQSHADGTRIPTVAELCTALGATSYLIMRGLRELKQEGLIFCPSSKSGTFLTDVPKKRVVGLLLEDGRTCDYINFPAWTAGFLSVFARHEKEYAVRTVHQAKWDDLPKTFEKLGIDVLVAVLSRNGKIREWDPGPLKSKLLLNFCNMPAPQDLDSRVNAVFYDAETWKTMYVSAAVRHGCRSFLQFGPKNETSAGFAAEIRRQGLEWDDGRQFATLDEKTLKRRLSKLIEKYQFDAVRCAGGVYQDFFCRQLKDFPGFRPYMPLFGNDHHTELIRNCPWLNSEILMEHLSNYLYRWGMFSAGQAIDMIEKGSVLSGMVFPMAPIAADQEFTFPKTVIRNVPASSRGNRQNRSSKV